MNVKRAKRKKTAIEMERIAAGRYSATDIAEAKKM